MHFSMPYRVGRDVLYASVGARFVAFLIDMMIIGALEGIFSNLLGLFGIVLSEVALLVSSFLFTACYFTLLTKWLEGQTLGKMILKIRVVSALHEDLTWSDVLLREGLWRHVMNLIMLPYLVAFVTEQKASLADLLVDTRVVRDDVYRALDGMEDDPLPEVESSIEPGDAYF